MKVQKLKTPFIIKNGILTIDAHNWLNDSYLGARSELETGQLFLLILKSSIDENFEDFKNQKFETPKKSSRKRKEPKENINIYNSSSKENKGGVGGEGENKKSESSKIFEIPESLKNPEFEEAFQKFVEHRIQIRKKLSNWSVKSILKKLERWGVEKSIRSINQTLENGWSGLFLPQDETKNERRYSNQPDRNADTFNAPADS